MPDFFIIVKLTKVDKNHTTMQGISTPAGNHGNTPRVPAAVGSLASSRISGLSNSFTVDFKIIVIESHLRDRFSWLEEKAGFQG
jgi:hypothetical protein